MSTVSAATIRSRLKSHGLELSKRRPSSIKGMVERSEGYLVTTGHSGDPEVTWTPSTLRRLGIAERDAMVKEALDAAVPALTGFSLVRTAWSITVRRSESA